MDIPISVARWVLLAASVGFTPESPIDTERQAIAIADQKVKELGYYRHPVYRARESKTSWHILVRDEGVPVLGGFHFIDVDKRTGKVTRVEGGK